MDLLEGSGHDRGRTLNNLEEGRTLCPTGLYVRPGS